MITCLHLSTFAILIAINDNLHLWPHCQHIDSYLVRFHWGEKLLGSTCLCAKEGGSFLRFDKGNLESSSQICLSKGGDNTVGAISCLSDNLTHKKNVYVALIPTLLPIFLRQDNLSRRRCYKKVAALVGVDGSL